jgi:hypothetical protein
MVGPRGCRRHLKTDSEIMAKAWTLGQILKFEQSITLDNTGHGRIVAADVIKRPAQKSWQKLGHLDRFQVRAINYIGSYVAWLDRGCGCHLKAGSKIMAKAWTLGQISKFVQSITSDSTRHGRIGAAEVISSPTKNHGKSLDTRTDIVFE